MKEVSEQTKNRDWFVKEPFLVPAGTKITYIANDRKNACECISVNDFMSDTKHNIALKEVNSQRIYSHAASPAHYLGDMLNSTIEFELPNQYIPGKTVYCIPTGKKLEISPTQEFNKNNEYIYCKIPGEKGEYLIDKDKLSFEPIIKRTKYDSIWVDESSSFDKENLEYFPSSDTSDYKPNSEGGIKFDSKKARPTLLLKSMPNAVQEVIEVLELGARKYAPDNWKKVENERYHDAMLRHMLSYLAGEINDPETSRHHLAHAICNMLFLIEKESEE